MNIDSDSKTKGRVLIIYERENGQVPFSVKVIDRALTDRGWTIEVDYKHQESFYREGWWKALWKLTKGITAVISITSYERKKTYDRSRCVDSEYKFIRQIKKPMFNMSCESLDEMTAKEWEKLFNELDKELAEVPTHYDRDPESMSEALLFMEFDEAYNDVYGK